jgi:hypothetical protein
MSVLTQGTEMWVRLQDSNGYHLLKINCPTGITGGGGSKPQIDDTCLDDVEMKYKPGMAAPGALSVPINFDPSDASHVALWDSFEAIPAETLHWIIGWGDGTSDPSVNSGTGIITYPNTRTWVDFDGYIADLPIDFALNQVVKSTMSIQRSGARNLHPKT